MELPVRIEELHGGPVVEVIVKNEWRFCKLLLVHRTWFRFKEDYWLRLHFADGTFEEFVIPAGFESNGASVPFLAQAIIPAQRILKPAFCHDFRYGKATVSRKKADALFHLGCLQLAKAHPVRAWLAWAAVRIGAHSNYNWQRAVA